MAVTNVVIAEKNEAARDIAAALCGGPEKTSDIKLPARGNGYIVCGASGHLLALVEPAAVDEAYAHTEVEDLPILIYPWPKAPQGAYQAKKLAEIERALAECTGTIYHAGDADDEGQLIVDEILEHAGIDPTDPRVMRAYVNDNIAKNIRRAFEQATPNAEHVSDGYAAQARSLGDFCFGVNESRLASAKLKARVSVGRVQTPTLGLVVERDRAREGHSKRTYYELAVKCVDSNGAEYEFTWKPPKDALEDGKHCFDKEYLERAAHCMEGRAFNAKMGVERKKAASPLPFNLTDLTADMSKRYGMSGDDVMKATQELRDAYKAITYNRAESRHLPTEHLASAPAVAAIAKANIGFGFDVDPTRRHAAFDDKKVGAHHGIIPQETALDVKGMPAKLAATYESIATRYLCLFMGPLVYDEAAAEASESNGTLVFKRRFAVEAGWTEAAPKSWCSVALAEGEAPAAGLYEFTVKGFDISERQTSPPPAFTDGTLMVAMSNIARYVKDEEVKRILKEKDENSTTEHGSIGTAATRASIIEALIKRGFIEREKKGKLVSTEKGRKFYDLIPDTIKGADMTARWYLVQKQVAEGTAPQDAVMKSVCEEFSRHRDSAYEGMSLQTTIGTCPKCGGAVVQRGKSFTCASNKSEKRPDGTWVDVAGCGFKLYPFCGKVLTAKQAASLLAGKHVPLKGCVSKAGNKFDCKLTLDENHEYKPIFENSGKKPSKQGTKRASNKGVSAPW